MAALGASKGGAADDDGRVANAFLFCGSRGVGKTSMARIFAKALNCPDTKDGEPGVYRRAILVRVKGTKDKPIENERGAAWEAELRDRHPHR